MVPEAYTHLRSAYKAYLLHLLLSLAAAAMLTYVLMLWPLPLFSGRLREWAHPFLFVYGIPAALTIVIIEGTALLWLSSAVFTGVSSALIRQRLFGHSMSFHKNTARPVRLKWSGVRVSIVLMLLLLVDGQFRARKYAISDIGDRYRFVVRIEGSIELEWQDYASSSQLALRKDVRLLNVSLVELYTWKPVTNAPEIQYYCLSVSSVVGGAVVVVAVGLCVYTPLQAIYRIKGNRCPVCGYALIGNVSGTCPECGLRLLPMREEAGAIA
jgi:hypothetical protein